MTDSRVVSRSHKRERRKAQVSIIFTVYKSFSYKDVYLNGSVIIGRDDSGRIGGTFGSVSLGTSPEASKILCNSRSVRPADTPRLTSIARWDRAESAALAGRRRHDARR